MLGQSEAGTIRPEHDPYVWWKSGEGTDGNARTSRRSCGKSLSSWRRPPTTWRSRWRGMPMTKAKTSIWSRWHLSEIRYALIHMLGSTDNVTESLPQHNAAAAVQIVPAPSCSPRWRRIVPRAQLKSVGQSTRDGQASESRRSPGCLDAGEPSTRRRDVENLL